MRSVFRALTCKRAYSGVLFSSEGKRHITKTALKCKMKEESIKNI